MDGLLNTLKFVHKIYIYIYIGKAAPLQAWTGPEGS